MAEQTTDAPSSAFRVQTRWNKTRLTYRTFIGVEAELTTRYGDSQHEFGLSYYKDQENASRREVCLCGQ